MPAWQQQHAAPQWLTCAGGVSLTCQLSPSHHPSAHHLQLRPGATAEQQLQLDPPPVGMGCLQLLQLQQLQQTGQALTPGAGTHWSPQQAPWTGALLAQERPGVLQMQVMATAAAEA